MSREFNKTTFILNILFHIFILFTFLTFIFYRVVAHTEKSLVKNEFDKVIDGNLNKFLNELDDTKISVNDDDESVKDYIDWNEVEKLSAEQIEKTEKPDPEIKAHNDEVKYTAYIMIGIIFAGLIGTILYLKFGEKKQNIYLNHIILENVITFCVIGGLEYLFYTKIISQFIPTYPDSASIEMINRFKSYF